MLRRGVRERKVEDKAMIESTANICFAKKDMSVRDMLSRNTA